MHHTLEGDDVPVLYPRLGHGTGQTLDELGKGSVLAGCAPVPMHATLLSFHRSLEDAPDAMLSDGPGHTRGHCILAAWKQVVVPDFNRIYLSLNKEMEVSDICNPYQSQFSGQSALDKANICSWLQCLLPLDHTNSGNWNVSLAPGTQL